MKFLDKISSGFFSILFLHRCCFPSGSVQTPDSVSLPLLCCGLICGPCPLRVNPDPSSFLFLIISLVPLPSLLLWFSTLPKLLFCTKEQDQPFLGSLTLVEGKAPRKRVMEAFLEHALTDTDFHTRTACTLPPTLTFVMYSVANPAQTLQCQT